MSSENAELPALKTPKFVTFPVIHDPNFGDTSTADVASDPRWLEAAASVVFDPENTRQERLKELKDELANRSIKLYPGREITGAKLGQTVPLILKFWVF